MSMGRLSERSGNVGIGRAGEQPMILRADGIPSVSGSSGTPGVRMPRSDCRRARRAQPPALPASPALSRATPTPRRASSGRGRQGDAVHRARPLDLAGLFVAAQLEGADAKPRRHPRRAALGPARHRAARPHRRAAAVEPLAPGLAGAARDGLAAQGGAGAGGAVHLPRAGRARQARLVRAPARLRPTAGRAAARRRATSCALIGQLVLDIGTLIRAPHRAPWRDFSGHLYQHRRHRAADHRAGGLPDRRGAGLPHLAAAAPVRRRRLHRQHPGHRR